MKLVYPEWEKQIVWENGRYPVVALENRACHFRIVQELSEAAAGGDTRFVLSEGEHLLDMGRKAAFVPSPWSMDFSGRAVMTAFYSRVKKKRSGRKSGQPRRRPPPRYPGWRNFSKNRFPSRSLMMRSRIFPR